MRPEVTELGRVFRDPAVRRPRTNESTEAAPTERLRARSSVTHSPAHRLLRDRYILLTRKLRRHGEEFAQGHTGWESGAGIRLLPVPRAAPLTGFSAGTRRRHPANAFTPGEAALPFSGCRSFQEAAFHLHASPTFLDHSLPWAVVRGSPALGDPQGSTHGDPRRSEGIRRGDVPAPSLQLPPRPQLLAEALQDSEPVMALPGLGDNGSSARAQNSAGAPVAVLKRTLTFVCNLFSQVSPELPHVRVPRLSCWDRDVIRG